MFSSNQEIVGQFKLYFTNFDRILRQEHRAWWIFSTNKK